MKTSSAADLRDAVSRHVPAWVLSNANVRIVGAEGESTFPGWAGLTLDLSSEGDCVYATGWLPEEGEHGTYWFSVWRNGVETQRTPYWDPVTGADYGWL